MSEDGPLLPCGTPVGDLLERVADGEPLTPHQRGCPYCGAALAELRGLWEDLAELRGERVAVPPGLLAGVMRRARALPRRPPALPEVAGWRPGREVVAVLAGPRGVTRIAERVVLDVVRAAAADAVTGLRVLSAEAEAEAEPLAVRLRVAVPYGPSLPEAAARVRALTAARLEGQCGLGGAVVDVVVADILAGSR